MNKVTHILGKSMPRSGHHILVDILKEYFESDLLYCDYYEAENCCRSIPCKFPFKESLGNKYFFQKGHDHHGRSDIKLDGYKYIIQYRSPIKRILSDFDLHTNTRPNKDDRRFFLDNYIKTQTDYFIFFYNKWILNCPDDSIVILYDDFNMEKYKWFEKVIRHINYNHTLNEEKLKNIINKYDKNKDETGRLRGERNPNDFRFFDKEAFENCEKRIKQNCPDIRQDIFIYI